MGPRLRAAARQRSIHARRGRFVAPLSLVALGIFGASCQVTYVVEQAAGQFSILSRRVSLDDPGLSESLEPAEAAKLAWAPRILEFCRTELGLDPGSSYTAFVDTGDDPVTTVVLASHPTAFVPHRWCFPIAGCVPYKGFFDRRDAWAEMSRLRERGLDVAVLDVEAYSTLGWFDDPIVSGMLERSLPEFANTLIHEVVHATLYYPDATTINESLATWIARDGVERFLAQHPEAANAAEIAKYRALVVATDADAVLLERTRRDLEVLYRLAQPVGEKLRRKAEVLRSAGRARSLLFGPAFTLPASNAFLLAAADYQSLVPTFAALQARVGGTPRDLMTYLLAEWRSRERYPPELGARIP
jgi:predicted aminopeptidase